LKLSSQLSGFCVEVLKNFKLVDDENILTINFEQALLENKKQTTIRAHETKWTCAISSAQ